MGRVVVVTGAGQGLGRAHAHAFAAEGYDVVVNDVAAAADAVAAEITAAGGSAIASAGDVADWDYAAALVATAVERFGDLHVLVNNAGIVRDRMLVGMGEREWDEVLRVDLKGHFCPLRHAAAHWRAQAKAGRPVSGRIVNTSSGAGLLGSVGQGNYSAAKAGVLGLTIVAAAELGRYGVTVNALAPAARTPMTEAVFAHMRAVEGAEFDAMAPENVSPLVVWLGSAEAGGVTGRVFEVEGGRIGLADGWRSGPRRERGRRWKVAEAGKAVIDLVAEAEPPPPVYGAG
ncbi:SDR family oxidoreductase [Pseudonocardia humida]|uniref:SDR family NAD(P)-dependent oxidoreductase n=1 Tax=Pseudonocardia humida TaxID=2800819 RepID=A0ABT0ZXM8_9PSEU|nr:SDR family oxidoreductase [Pseudonocardia humida]MCO1655502.1 SDR family NAD(P)-dependent oxidoreductase [Pseudonocardia humida]